MFSKISDRILQYLFLMRLHRPIGIYLLLWPTLWALWIAAQGVPDIRILIIFILGAVVMRSAGCVINDLIDHEFDGHVQRTKYRPLVSGKVSHREAIGLFLFLCVIACVLLFFLNRFTQYLAIICILLIIIYPFTKRYVHIPQLFLGLAYAWSIPMAFAAQINHVPAIAWLIYVAAVMWAIIYDTMYAMVDREDDLRIGIKSTAILFGNYDRVCIAMLQALLLIILLMLGMQLQFTMSYYVALIFATANGFYLQYLIKDTTPEQCFRAFLRSHWFGLIIFIGIICVYW